MDCDSCGRYDDDYDTHMYCVSESAFDRVSDALDHAESQRDAALEDLRALQTQFDILKEEAERLRWSTIVRRDSW